MQPRAYWPYRHCDLFSVSLSMSSAEKSLERSASSAGLGVPRREVSSTLAATRPRANTGSRTPKMMGLGVPTEKVVTGGRALERRESLQCLGAPPAVSPVVLGAPTSSPGESMASSVVSDNSNLSVLREDLPTPPLATLLTDSEDDGAAVDDGPSSVLVPPPSSFIAARSRRGTTSSQKSVNFDPVPEEVPPYSAAIRVKTVEFSDPDPTFHRAIGSPVTPKDEAHVEQVGAFRVTNLRNDSLGNLPRIVSTAPSSEETTPVELEEDEELGRAFHNDGDAEPEVQTGGAIPPNAPKKGSSWRTNPLVKNFLTLPSTAKARAGGGGHSEGWVLTTPSTATTAVSSTHAHQEGSVICSTCRLEEAIADIGPLVLEDVWEGGSGSGSTRVKGGIAASIKSVHEILWKDDSSKPAPQSSRRSSAWALGQGSLGIAIDPGSGEVRGTSDAP